MEKNDNKLEDQEEKEQDVPEIDKEKPLEEKLKETEEKPLEEKLKETEEKLLRSLAEIENQRRRFEKDIKDAFDYGAFNFAKENLAILDNLQRARLSIQNDESLKDNQDLEKFIKNLDILEKDLLTIFEKNKIKKIITTKTKFDPNLHQAMLEVEDENSEPGTIVQEIQPGYMFGDRLLRPSFVGISKKGEAKNDENSQQKDEKKDQ